MKELEIERLTCAVVAIDKWFPKHPSGPHQQNEFCAWRTPKTEGGVK